MMAQKEWASAFWDREEDAEAYERAAFADVRKALEPFIAGAPEVRKYRLTTSTVDATVSAG